MNALRAEWVDAEKDLNSEQEMIVRCARYSLVILPSMVVESELRSFCAEVAREKREDGSLPQKDLLRKVKEFLKRDEISIPLPPNWEKIRTLYKTRDCIVHRAGRLKDSNGNTLLAQWLGQIPGLSTTTDRYTKYEILALGREFCEWAHGESSAMFESLSDAAGYSPTRIIYGE
ncbi:MAG: hypothetical protein HY650_00825 [Acidobacteria bacterium]|nr:hypothetical protein [Acidobacteriota bacterium]